MLGEQKSLLNTSSTFSVMLEIVNCAVYLLYILNYLCYT